MPPRLNILSSACKALARGVTRPVTVAAAPHQQQQNAFLMAAARRFSDNTTSPTTPPGQDDSVLHPSMFPQNQQSDHQIALSKLEMVAYGLNPFDVSVDGHKFGLPELPIPSEMHKSYRYDAVVNLMTKLLMKDGKLAKAQRDMTLILAYLRKASTPKLNPARPLVGYAPAPEFLPLDPVMYLRVAIDSVAPLIKIRHFKGMAGGGRALEVPAPLAERQRRRTAFGWILDAAAKKKSKGSGRTMFPHRVAEEIVAVVEGKSSVWDKRFEVHKRGTAVRANLNDFRLKTLM
ncbi:ribosomal protein S7 domain-containing protein [Podospora australis]|uniref:Small ribosomal subunit protein uS7m n=1 Tax=Podospora australis TaxID=1536484 RepID=A0AAN6WWA7_9PEZI|nr:ribosomal protein S7 domain-containing protein [Podospora australis]